MWIMFECITQKSRSFHPIIPTDYSQIERLSIDKIFIPKGFNNFYYLLDPICEINSFVLAITQTRTVQVVEETLIY